MSTSKTHANQQATEDTQLDLFLLWLLGGGGDLVTAKRELPAAGLANGPEEVERALAGLIERGWLREAGAATAGGQYVVTERGRREMSERFAQWTASRRTLAARLAEVEQLRSDLLSTLSHELRTPLTLIRTSTGLLLDSKPDRVMRRRLLNNIKQSADRMTSLVTDVLDLARLQSDRLDLQIRQVNLGELAAGAIALLQPLLDTRQQRVRLALPDPAPVIPGDYQRLERVLLNLIGNANKFAPAGSEIGLTLTEDANQVTIAISDSGPGIAPESIPRLFEQFFTERTSSSRHNIGAGLGLPIARGIVESHGGRIWVTSQVGEGTTVHFTLPKTLHQGVVE